MTVILHPPGEVSFSGDPVPLDEQTRIARVLQAAVQRAIDTAVRDGAARPAAARWEAGELAQPYDPARADPVRGTYQVPGYHDAGRPTGVELLELIPEAAPGTAVDDGPSPLEGRLLASLPGNTYVYLRSPRHVSAGSLIAASELGLAVFGTTSFAILQGPLGSPTMRYWAVGTDPSVANADLGRRVASTTEDGTELLPPDLAGHDVAFTTHEDLLLTVTGSGGGEYLTRGLVTRDRMVHWPTVPLAQVWYAQLAAEQHKGMTAPPAQEFRRLVFAEIDRLVARIEGGDETDLQRAAELLSRMDRVAFRLVDWETKVGYLKVLLAAWTWQEQEVAVVQIFASLDNGAEVDAMVALLRRAGRYDQLFDDLDSEVYTLLTTVGERFPRDPPPLTLDGLVALLQSMGLIPKTLPEILLGTLVAGRGDPSLASDALDQAYDAVMGFVRFGADLGESLITLVTEPGKVIEGLGRLLVVVTLASLGYPPALLQIAQLLAALGRKDLAGMRGADRLGCGEKIVRRVKWRLVWEIASLFVGVGEVKAAVEGLGVAEKLAGVARFLRVLTRLGEVADAEAAAARLARLTELITAERTAFAGAEEVAELLSRLPDDDVRRLGALLATAEVRQGETLAELATRSRNLGFSGTLEDAVGKAELLKTMAGKAGGLTDEITEAFHLLLGEGGLDLADARRVVAAIGDGEAVQFAAALRRIPLPRLAADARAAFLEMVAASPRRMEAVTELGVETFTAVYRRAAGRGEVIDEYLAVLREVAGGGDAAELRRLLDRVAADEPAAWLEIENARRVRAGQRAVADWAEQLGGSPRAQRGLDRLLRRDQEAMVDSLIDDLAGDRGLISDREVVLALEEIAGMGEGELDGLLELRRYVDRAGPHGGFPDWNELLFTEPERRHNLLEALAGLRDPARPADLVVHSGLEEVIATALREPGTGMAGKRGGVFMNGAFGHLEAARSLLRDFPGARFRFELTKVAGGARRDVDIVVELELAGRQVDVEVKGYQATTALSDHTRWQIRKDLLLHQADPGGPWEDLLWRFADPGYANNVSTVERIFTEELAALIDEGRITIPATEEALTPLDRARAGLAPRFTAAPPWKLIDVLH